MLKFTSLKFVGPLRHAGHKASCHIKLRGSEPQWVSGLKLCIEISSQVTPSTLPPPTTLTRKCPRDIPSKMPLKLTIRNISRPICQGLENALERAGKREAAQRFRQIQHERFGLSNSEWEGLRFYFIYDELIWISRQRGVSFWYMIEDIMQTPEESRAEQYESLCAIFIANNRWQSTNLKRRENGLKSHLSIGR